VDGGYRVRGRKIFVSGAPAGDLFMTMAIHDDPEHGPTVLHLAIPLDAPGLAIQDTWRTLGMRGTGSHDIVLDNVFVPAAAIGVRRPPGRWEPWHVVAVHVEPLIYAVYVGIAEAARALASTRPPRAATMPPPRSWRAAWKTSWRPRAWRCAT
jgi:alkylation response protein AidB-like acyl-CoA dehydrogenase